MVERCTDRVISETKLNRSSKCIVLEIRKEEKKEEERGFFVVVVVVDVCWSVFVSVGLFLVVLGRDVAE